MSEGRLQKRFGAVVRQRREAAGISQEALADSAGLHRTYISLLERGQRNPSLEVIAALAEGLNTSMASLVGALDR
ncbi:helix-turn-helix domain-containing protein [Myxococcota bacterium]|nr:helix-turn-helix domain-containing protein [Myxococcota bacterium]